MKFYQSTLITFIYCGFVALIMYNIIYREGSAQPNILFKNYEKIPFKKFHFYI